MRLSWLCLFSLGIILISPQTSSEGLSPDNNDAVAQDDSVLIREKRQVGGGSFGFGALNPSANKPDASSQPATENNGFGFTFPVLQGSAGHQSSNNGFTIGFSPQGFNAQAGGHHQGSFHDHSHGNHNHAIGFGNNQGGSQGGHGSQPSSHHGGNHGNRGGNHGNRGNAQTHQGINFNNQGHQSGGGGGNKRKKQNCRGKRRNNPECQDQNQGNGEVQDGGQGGGQGLNCRKRRNRNKPECRDPDIELNCSGRRKKTPECRNAIKNHPKCRGNKKFKKQCLGTGEASQAFEEIEWLTQLQSGDLSVVIPGLPDTPSASAAQTRFSLADGQPDVPFHSCRTPDFGEPGHCRYLQHCILPAFIQNFQTFLSYVCFINGEFLGVCCPDSRYPEVPTTTTRRPTRPSTTLRPPTPKTSTGCGLNTRQQTRIVGGTRAEPNEFPWAAALLREGDAQYCGGVLISNRHVLTAAHCIDGFDQTTIKVRLGEYTFEEDTGHQDFTLATMKMHESYDTTTYVNDIALLTLARTTDFSNEIWPVCLPPPGDNFVGKTGTVVGWGTIYYGGPTSTVLQKVNLPVWTNAECDAAYKDNTIFEQNLCAGDRAGGKDSCQGDSGGPLLLQIGPRWATIGVVSWGIRCAEPGNPGVYARVNMYLDWIDRNTN